MANVGKTAASFRMFGDDLDSEEISRLLGATPTRSARKGDIRRFSSGRECVERSGFWLLVAEDAVPGDLTRQITQILNSLTGDVAIWADVSQRYSCDIFCGLFMDGGDESEEISLEVISMMATRGLRLALSLYSPVID